MTGIMWECTECGATRLGLFYPDGASLAVEDTDPGDTRDLRCSECSEGEWPDSDDVVTEHVAFEHDRGTRVEEDDPDPMTDGGQDAHRDTGIDPEYEDDAKEIGLLGMNIGERTSVTAVLSDRIGDYDTTTEDVALPSGQHADVYRYERDTETRYVAEAIDQVAIDEVRYHSFVFDHEPSAREIARAALIANVQLGTDQ